MKIVALTGGVGGSKLVFGLAQCIDPRDLTVIVNTGDDFMHYGLYICPDLDTVCYSLANISNPETGWGIKDETFIALIESTRLGGPDWFKIGDKDLGTHLERTRRMEIGQKLSYITKSFCESWGITSSIYPMSDDRVSTIISTIDGDLPFQEYFVRLKCLPVVKKISFKGIDEATPPPGLIEKINQADFVIICPSNPFVSIDPILGIKEIKKAISSKVNIAISPIVKQNAIKGPAAKMFKELELHPSASAVAEFYSGLIKGFILDRVDEKEKGEIERYGIICHTTETIMNTQSRRVELAKSVINFYQNKFN
jgi:LPPG:FO 2-phospho-L-lactate transferase